VVHWCNNLFFGCNLVHNQSERDTWTLQRGKEPGLLRWRFCTEPPAVFLIQPHSRCLVEPHQTARTLSSLGISSISATHFLHQRRCTTSIEGSWRREDDDGVGDATQMANQPSLRLWNEDPPEYCKPPLFSSSFFLLCFPPPWPCLLRQLG
jgi:hypothetical protein